VYAYALGVYSQFEELEEKRLVSASKIRQIRKRHEPMIGVASPMVVDMLLGV
jgi:hypothetical protein